MVVGGCEADEVDGGRVVAVCPPLAAPVVALLDADELPVLFEAGGGVDPCLFVSLPGFGLFEPECFFCRLPDAPADDDEELYCCEVPDPSEPVPAVPDDFAGVAG